MSAALLLATTPICVAAGSGTVSGTLYDDDTGGFASAVLVGGCSQQGCITNSASDPGGAYRVDLPAGNGWNVYTEVGCGASDYARAHKYGVNVSDNLTTDHIDLHLTRRKGSIAGRVLDSHGHPVPNVGLVVDNSETGGFGIGGTTSGADGSFVVDCLAAAGVAGSGAYFITALPPASSGFGQKMDSGIGVRAGQVVTHDVILNDGGGSFTGRVTCGGNTCPAPVGVLVYCEDCTSSSNITTDSSGAYVSGHLEAGKHYDIHAVGPAGWDNEIHYGVSVGEGRTTTVDLDLVRSGASWSGSLTGRVTDAAGAAYGNCLINAFGGVAGTAAGGWTDGYVYTLPDGRYDTGFLLAPGDYLVFVICPGWPRMNVNGGHTVSVRAGAESTASYTFADPIRPLSGGHSVVGSTSEATQAFFAAGTTAFTSDSTVREFLTIENPGEAQVMAVTYLFKSGDPLTRLYELPAAAQMVINVNAEVGANQEVSAWLTAATPFLAERAMYYAAADGTSGGTDVMGVQAPRSTYYFAEGYTGNGFDEELVLLNPDSEAAATAAITYYFAEGPPKTVLHVVPALSRLTVTVNDQAEAGPWQQVSAGIVSDLPIIAERSMSFRYAGRNGTSAVIGATTPATSLDLAEGHVGDGFVEFLSLLNPTADPATATLTYHLGAATQTQTVHLAAQSRATLKVNDFVAANTDCAVHIDSDVPLVAERASYFAVPPSGWSGGHATVAMPTTSLGRRYIFAGDYAGNNSIHYYAVFNPGSSATTVTFTRLTDTGARVVKSVIVPAGGRITEVANDGPAAVPGWAEVTASSPVMVERATYFAF